MIYRIFEILFPVFTVIMVGYLYARYRSTDMSTANRLNIEVFSPALTFSVLSSKSFALADYQSLVLGAVIIVLGSGIILWPLVRWLGISAKMFLPSMMFSNAGNIGLPVLIFAFGTVAMQAAVLLLSIVITLHFTLGIYLLNRHASWLSIFKLPMILATLVGLAVSIAQIKVPALLLIPIKMLGDCAIPLMLLSLGVRLVDLDLTHWQIGLLGAILRPVSGLVIFLLIRPWLELTPLHSGMLLVFAVFPPAVFNYVLAEQYQQSPQEVAAIVMLGNLMSVISLPIVLTFALPLALGH